MTSNKVLMVDAETDGLYGPVIAIGAVTTDGHIFSGRIADDFPGQPENAWVLENVWPHLQGLPQYENRIKLLDSFWDFYLKLRHSHSIWADYGSPVESGLFRSCVLLAEEERAFLGPYPLHDVASALVARGYNPDMDRVENSGLTDLQRHNPVDDCRASIAILRKYVFGVHI